MVSPIRSNPSARTMLDDVRESRNETGTRYVVRNFASLRNAPRNVRRIVRGGV